MPKTILMDQLHITFLAPANLPNSAYAAMRRTLKRKQFIRRLGKSIRNAVARFAALRSLRTTLDG